MSWNWIDVLVVLLAVGQIGLVVAIGVIVGRIKAGPVARLSGAIGRNVASGKKLLETGKTAGLAAVPHLARTRAALVRLPRAFRPIVLTDAPVSYGSLLRNMDVLLVLRGRKPVRGMVRRGTTRFVEKAGLVPPNWKRIAPLTGYAGTALTVWREVQKQLPEIRRVLSERDSG